MLIEETLTFLVLARIVADTVDNSSRVIDR